VLSARAISVPGEINTFPLGESADISALVPVLDQLAQEIKNLKVILAEQSTRIAFLESHQKVEPIPQDLKEKVDSQSATIAAIGSFLAEQEEKIASQDKKIVILETSHDQDIERLALEAAHDRQRVTKLEQHVQPLQRDRGEILRALIAASGGKVLAKYARLKMHLDKATFSRLLNTISDHVARKVHQPDRRQKLLVLIS
jgi:hypothetical protein